MWVCVCVFDDWKCVGTAIIYYCFNLQGKRYITLRVFRGVWCVCIWKRYRLPQILIKENTYFTHIHTYKARQIYANFDAQKVRNELVFFYSQNYSKPYTRGETPENFVFEKRRRPVVSEDNFCVQLSSFHSTCTA